MLPLLFLVNALDPELLVILAVLAIEFRQLLLAILDPLDANPLPPDGC